MGLELPIDITSAFKDKGFKEAKKQMEQFEEAGQNMDMSVDELTARMNGLNATATDSGSVAMEGKSGFLSMSEAAEILKSEQGALAAMSERTGREMDDLDDFLNKINFSLKKAGEDGAVKFRDEITNSMVESRKAGEAAQQQMQRFRFDMLSLMFAGMELSRVFQGLLNPAMEAFGVFDLISDMLTIFFLPAASMVMNAVMRISSFFMGLPEPVKNAINVFAVAAVIVGTLTKAITILVMNLKPLGLAIGKVIGLIKGPASFIGVVKGLGTTLLGKSGVAAISAFAATLSAPVVAIAGVIGAIAGLAVAWKKNWGDIRQRTGKAVQFIADQFTKVIELAEPLLEANDILLRQLNRIPGVDIGDSPMTDGLDTAIDKMDALGQSAIDSGNELDKAGEAGPEQDVRDDGSFGGAGFGNTFDPMGQDGSVGQTNVNDIDSVINVEGKRGQDEAELADEVAMRQEEVFVGGLRGR